MAATLGRICGAGLLKSSSASPISQVTSYSTRDWTRNRKALIGSLGVLAGGAGALLFALDRSVKASELELHAPINVWAHNGIFSALDHARQSTLLEQNECVKVYFIGGSSENVRRGYEVYKQVCAACHSLRFVAYRDLVGFTHTEEEAKAEAEEQMITDGPDEAGNMFQRPGKLADYFPNPYPNEEAARAANNGAFPPDLTYIIPARHGCEDYIFALLTGYCEAPAGINLREGQYYNPYFIGGAISMAQSLFNEVIEYSDGTPASASQLAKDISTFLKWTAEPEHDDRKKMMIKGIALFTILTGLCYYVKRMKWTTIKTRKIEFRPKK